MAKLLVAVPAALIVLRAWRNNRTAVASAGSGAAAGCAGTDGQQSQHVSLAFCQALPKVELHAHLHGSIRDATLAELAAARRGATEAERAADVALCRAAAYGDRSLSDCFALFDLIHKLVTDVATVRRITREVVADFAAENVRYLELRTTPRAIPTARAYCEAVMGALEECERQLPSITVRLLLSVNRSGSPAEAEATAALAAELALQTKWVVGLDFSGNPHAQSFRRFEKAFRLARQAGLRTSVHTAEVPDEADTAAILAFRPDRLGHALHLKGYPISVCTDDSGVFGTSLSRELLLVAHAFGLGENELWSLTVRSTELIFCEVEKPRLQAQFVAAYEEAAAALQLWTNSSRGSRGGGEAVRPATATEARPRTLSAVSCHR